MTIALPVFPSIPFDVTNLKFLWTADMGMSAWTPTGDVALTFARASEARTWRETGDGWVIDVAANNVPRYSLGGLVIERGPEVAYPVGNICLYSEAQDNGAYSAIGSGNAVPAAGVAAPESGKTSYEITGSGAGDGWKQALTAANTFWTFIVALKADAETTVKLSMDGGTTTKTVRLTTKWQPFTMFRTGANPSPSIIVDDSSGKHIYCFGWMVQKGYLGLYPGYVPTTNAIATIALEACYANVADIAGFPTGDNDHTLAACGLPFGSLSDGFLAVTSAYNYPDGAELAAYPSDISAANINKLKYTYLSGTDSAVLGQLHGVPTPIVGMKSAALAYSSYWFVAGRQMQAINRTANLNGGRLFIGGIAWAGATISARQIHGIMYCAAVFSVETYDEQPEIARWMSDVAHYLREKAGTSAALPTLTVPTGLALTDPETNGDLTVAWSNGGSYVAGDKVVLKLWKTADGEGTASYYFFDATAGTGKVSGLTNASEYTGKAYATSDNYVASSYTSTTTGTPTAGAVPVFSGITSLVDNGDGTLTAGWGAATGEHHFEIHLKTAAFAGSDLADRTYLVGASDADTTSMRVSMTAAGAKLTAAQEYYCVVRAVNDAGTDGNSTALSETVTNPLASSSPAPMVMDGDTALLGAAATTVYTCPATKKAMIKFTVTNVDSSDRTVTMYKVPSGGAAGDLGTLLKTFTLTAYGAPYVSGVHVLNPGETLQGLCSVADKASCDVAELEETFQ